MLFNVIHDLSLLVTDIQRSGGSISRWGQGGRLWIRGMDVADSFIK